MSQATESTRRPIRVLVVDDVSASRRALIDALAAEDGVEIVGSASTVRTAETRIAELTPDVVVSKLDFSERGVTLPKLLSRAKIPVPVVMFDVDLEPGSPRSLDARLSGAAACLTRPSIDSDLLRVVRTQLTPMLQQTAFPAVREAAGSSNRTAVAEVPAEKQQRVSSCLPAKVVVIAASTGGPDALCLLLSGLPRDLSIPVLIVQHMPSGFIETLAERLTAQTGRKVLTARDQAVIDDAPVWIAPAGRHLLIERSKLPGVRLRLSNAEPENSCRPSADVLFRSVAAVFGARTLAVVLTGMGQDGMQGCRAVRQQGGQVIVQDEHSSVVWSMPRAVASAGLADAILPLGEIAAEIMRRCQRGPT